jgi:hypothetical protein
MALGEQTVKLELLSGHTASVVACKATDWPEVIYFCGREKCIHFQGQRGLLPGSDSMKCALVGYPPDRLCQPFYLEGVVALDQARRSVWERLDSAEAFERAVRVAGGEQ